MASVRAVIVSYDDPAATGRAVASLRAQSDPPQEIVVVDNHPDGRLDDLEGAAVLRPGANLGYAGGANLGARGTACDWLLFLNPDAVAEPDCLARLLDATAGDVAIVGAQILLPDGRVNAGDNPVHVSGVSWSGAFGEPREDAPPRAVAAVSGAALLARRSAFEQLGGMTERFFLYHDDVDLSWRVRLAGWDVVYQPAAHVEHAYDFDKGRGKWFLLERNRAWTVLTAYAAPTLVLLAPMLAAAEVAITVRAVREGWWREKLRAWAALARWMPALARRRREVQASRRVGDDRILSLMTGRFDTSLVEPGAAGAAGTALDAYRRLVLRLVRA